MVIGFGPVNTKADDCIVAAEVVFWYLMTSSDGTVCLKKFAITPFLLDLVAVPLSTPTACPNAWKVGTVNTVCADPDTYCGYTVSTNPYLLSTSIGARVLNKYSDLIFIPLRYVLSDQ